MAGRYLIVNGANYRRSGGWRKVCGQLFGEFFCSVDIPGRNARPGQPKCALVSRRMKRPHSATYHHNCMSSDPLSASQFAVIMNINRLTTRWAGTPVESVVETFSSYIQARPALPAVVNS